MDAKKEVCEQIIKTPDHENGDDKPQQMKIENAKDGDNDKSPKKPSTKRKTQSSILKFLMKTEPNEIEKTKKIGECEDRTDCDSEKDKNDFENICGDKTEIVKKECAPEKIAENKRDNERIEITKTVELGLKLEGIINMEEIKNRECDTVREDKKDIAKNRNVVEHEKTDRAVVNDVEECEIEKEGDDCSDVRNETKMVGNKKEEEKFNKKNRPRTIKEMLAAGAKNTQIGIKRPTSTTIVELKKPKPKPKSKPIPTRGRTKVKKNKGMMKPTKSHQTLVNKTNGGQGDIRKYIPADSKINTNRDPEQTSRSASST